MACKRSSVRLRYSPPSPSKASAQEGIFIEGFGGYNPHHSIPSFNLGEFLLLKDLGRFPPWRDARGRRFDSDSPPSPSKASAQEGIFIEGFGGYDPHHSISSFSVGGLFFKDLSGILNRKGTKTQGCAKIPCETWRPGDLAVKFQGYAIGVSSIAITIVTDKKSDQ